MTIKELRNMTGLTQQKFADQFHISVDNVRNWEQGKSKPLECIPWLIERILILESRGEQGEKVNFKRD